jgi:hypothetical protein
MKNRLPIALCVLTSMALMIGCGSAQDEDSLRSGIEAPLSAKPKKLATFRMSWAAPQGSSPARSAHRAAQILLGGVALDERTFHHNGDRFAPTGRRPVTSETWDERPLPSIPALRVKYHPRFNDLRVSNSHLKKTYDGPDIGPSVAKETFQRSLRELEAAGVLVASDYDVSGAKASTTEFGVARLGEQAAPVIVEYVFQAMRSLNGIRVANGGVRVSVHRSGALSEIRVGGVTVERAPASASALLKDMPSAAGRVFEQRVNASDAHARFSREFPGVTEHSADLLYMMPDEEDEAVIAPRHVYQFSRRSMSDGQEIISRRKTVAYSAEDDLEAAENIGSAAKGNQADHGDPR